HAIPSAPSTPCLDIRGPGQSGKTVCMQLLDLVTRGGWSPGVLTSAVMYHELNTQRASTLLLDDRESSLRSQRLIDILAGGLQLDSAHMVWDSRGRDVGLTQLLFAKALAGSKRLPSLLAERSIPIILQPKRPGEKVQRFHKDRAKNEGLDLRELL